MSGEIVEVMREAMGHLREMVRPFWALLDRQPVLLQVDWLTANKLEGLYGGDCKLHETHVCVYLGRERLSRISLSPPARAIACSVKVVGPADGWILDGDAKVRRFAVKGEFALRSPPSVAVVVGRGEYGCEVAKEEKTHERSETK